MNEYDHHNIYTLKYKGVQERLSGRNKRLYFNLENAKNGIYSLARRYARENNKGYWSLLTTREKRELVNFEVSNFSIVKYSPSVILKIK